MRAPRKLLIFVGIGAILATCGLLFFSAQTESQSGELEWLQPAASTKLDWAILDLQANFRLEALAEKGLALNFRAGSDSLEKGVIHCDIDYTPSTSPLSLRVEERRISDLFERRRELFYRWAKLQFHRHAVDFPDSFHLRQAARIANGPDIRP